MVQVDPKLVLVCSFSYLQIQMGRFIQMRHLMSLDAAVGQVSSVNFFSFVFKKALP